MAATVRDTGARDNSPLGFFLSVLFHGAIVASAFVGVPFLQKDIIVEEAPVFMEIPVVDEITAAPPPPAPEPAPEPIVSPETPLVNETLPSETLPPPPEEQPTPPKEEEKKPDVAIVKPPPRKPPPPDTKKRDVAMLQDLLKDMQKNAPKPQAKETPAKPAETAKAITPNLSDRATISEKDAIIRHIEGCWRIDPGQEGIENMAAEVRVFINLDGSVQKVDIVDMARYFVDPQFRTFANSARNAVLGCGKIPISAQNYSLFKDMVMRFSPQGRIN